MLYILKVYRKDCRYKTGERLILAKEYPNYSGTAMMEEMASLRDRLYPRPQYRLDFDAV